MCPGPDKIPRISNRIEWINRFCIIQHGIFPPIVFFKIKENRIRSIIIHCPDILLQSILECIASLIECSFRIIFKKIIQKQLILDLTFVRHGNISHKNVEILSNRIANLIRTLDIHSIISRIAQGQNNLRRIASGIFYIPCQYDTAFIDFFRHRIQDVCFSFRCDFLNRQFIGRRSVVTHPHIPIDKCNRSRNTSGTYRILTANQLIFSLLENLKITLLRIIFQRIRPQRIYKQQIGTVFRVESALIVSLYFHFIKSGLFELYRPGGIDITRIRRYNFPCSIVGRQLVGIEILNVEKQFIIHAVILRSYLRIRDKTVLILRQNGGIQP